MHSALGAADDGSPDGLTEAEEDAVLEIVRGALLAGAGRGARRQHDTGARTRLTCLPVARAQVNFLMRDEQDQRKPAVDEVPSGDANGSAAGASDPAVAAAAEVGAEESARE